MRHIAGVDVLWLCLEGVRQLDFTYKGSLILFPHNLDLLVSRPPSHWNHDGEDKDGRKIKTIITIIKLCLLFAREKGAGLLTAPRERSLILLGPVAIRVVGSVEGRGCEREFRSGLSDQGA